MGAALLLLAEKYEQVRDALISRPVSLPFSAACTGEALVSILANGIAEQDFDRYTPNWEYPQVVPPEAVNAVKQAVYLCAYHSDYLNNSHSIKHHHTFSHSSTRTETITGSNTRKDMQHSVHVNKR